MTTDQSKMNDDDSANIKRKSLLDASENTDSRPVKKRNRVPVSCGPCRARRSKCDREHPCSTCSKRGEAQLCVYAKSGSNKSPQEINDDAQDNLTHAQDRLRHLENMVMQMAQKVAPPTSTTFPSSETSNANQISGPYQLAQDLPQVDDQRSDLTKPHWTSILNGIQELRSIMGTEDLTYVEDRTGRIEKPILLGAPPPASLQHVLNQYLPPRSQLERRLSVYYRESYWVLPIVVPSIFQKEYVEFWESPATANPAWVALLFAILSLSANVTRAKGSDEDATAQEQYLAAAAQCINFAGYVQPRKYLIEALILLCQGRYVTRLDPSREVAIIVSIVTRLAFQSGLHREPPASMPPLEAEMRRRCWLVCHHYDIQVACQLGIPPTISFDSHKVNEPRNLHNEELSENMLALPPSRPDNELTAISAFLAKSRLLRVLSEVYQHATSLNPTGDTTSEILRLDSAIRHVRNNIPDIYKFRPLSEALVDSQYTIMARLTCEFLAQKSICLLHRKRMAAGDEYSRRACVNAAVAIVKELTEFYVEFQCGGQFMGQQWMMSLTLLNDFLLASMILCASVVMSEKHNLPSADQTDKLIQVDMLQRAREVCLDLSSKSTGAARVGQAIDLVLAKLGGTISTQSFVTAINPANGLPSPSYSFVQSDSISNQYPDPQTQQQSSQQQQQSTTQHLFSGLLAAATPLDGPVKLAPSSYNPFDQLTTDSADIDWSAFDQYIYASSWEPV